MESPAATHCLPSGYESLRFSAPLASRLGESDIRVVITGAGGWFGRATMEMLESVWGKFFPQRVVAFGSAERTLILRSGREAKLRPLDEIVNLEPAPTILLHYAFLTKERTSTLDAQEYERRNATIRQLVTQAVRTIGVSHLMITSSGAVYGLPTRADRSLCDDPVSNPYGAGKIFDEQHFGGLAKDLELRIVVPRVFNVSGPYINKHDSYALSSIVNAALSGGPIRLRAAKRVIRAYTSIRDLLDVSLGWLFSGSDPASIVFDTRSSEALEVGQLAQMVSDVLQCHDVSIERPALIDPHDDRYLGDGALFETLAAQQGIVPADMRSQIRDTADYLRAYNQPARSTGS